MSLLAKVLVVLNLILAIFFLGVSATVFTTSKNWVEESNKEAAQTKEKLDELDKTLGKYKNSQVAQSSSISNLENNVEMLESKKTELEGQVSNVSNDNARMQKEIDTLNDRIAQKDRYLEDKDSEISQLNTRLTSSLEAQSTAEEEKKVAEKRYARARLDKEELEKMSTELATEAASLKARTSELENTLAIAEEQGLDLTTLVSKPLAPAIDAAVVAVSADVDLVVLSVGVNEKVEIGHEFTIYRGSNFVGKARVTKVTDDMAGARILYLNDDAAVEVGDKATTRYGL